MSIELITIFIIIAFIGLLILGLPLAFITGGTGVMLCLILWGPDALMLVVSRVFGLMGSYIFVAVPLFVFMGTMLQQSGVIDDLFKMLHLWLGPLRGGLASSTVLASTAMAAMTGIIGAPIVTMGLIALPELFRRNYHKNISLGGIMAGGCLGILIPPQHNVHRLWHDGRSIGGEIVYGGCPPWTSSCLFLHWLHNYQVLYESRAWSSVA